jgi:hypothetical protein
LPTIESRSRSSPPFAQGTHTATDPHGGSPRPKDADGEHREDHPQSRPDDLRGSEGEFTRLAFSPDGSKLAAKNFGREGTVRVGALDLDDLLEIAHEKVTQTWTDDECRQFLHMDACPASA